MQKESRESREREERGAAERDPTTKREEQRRAQDEQ
jgi:hypothetical protein